MKQKKKDRANLEKQTSVFLGIGFIVSISLTLIAFEWTSTTNRSNPAFSNQSGDFVQEVIPNTSPQPPKPPVPPPPPIPESLHLIKNDGELPEDPIFASLEATIDTEPPERQYSSDEKDDQGPDYIYIAEEMSNRSAFGYINILSIPK